MPDENINMSKIKVSIIGMGNCASSLVQGIYYYDGKSAADCIGLMNWDLGGYLPTDIEIVSAFEKINNPLCFNDSSSFSLWTFNIAFSCEVNLIFLLLELSTRSIAYQLLSII